MRSSENPPQHLLVTYSILTGLTPLIPVPLLDDLVYTYLLRDMARRLAGTYNLQLSKGDVNTLADQKGGSCCLGCLGTALLYLPKKIFAKLFFFLEWKRAADIVTSTYYHGLLLDTALQDGAVGRLGAERTRVAMDAVLARTNTSVVSRAVVGLIRQSHGLLKQLVAALMQALPRGRRDVDESKVADAVDAVESSGQGNPLETMVSRLEEAIATLPGEHFAEVKADLLRQLRS